MLLCLLPCWAPQTVLQSLLSSKQVGLHPVFNHDPQGLHAKSAQLPWCVLKPDLCQCTWLHGIFLEMWCRQDTVACPLCMQAACAMWRSLTGSKWICISACSGCNQWGLVHRSLRQHMADLSSPAHAAAEVDLTMAATLGNYLDGVPKY